MSVDFTSQMNVGCECSFDDDAEPFEHGGLHLAYKGTYTSGIREDQLCVKKLFNQYVVPAWILSGRIGGIGRQNCKESVVLKPFPVNLPEIFCSEDGEIFTVEPFIYKWRKFNRTSGWSPQDSKWG